MAQPASAPPPRLTIDVVELNPHAPRPFAFTEAALCLRDSIRATGLGCEHRVNIADPRAPCIVLGAVPPLHGPLAQLDARKAMVFNFEQLGSTSAIAGPEYLRWLRQWLVLDYHSANVDYLKRANGAAQQVLELPVVPGPSLRFRPELPDDKTVDVLFFGSLTPRRSQLLAQLEEAGMRVESVAGAYADELTPAIRRARLVLHVHYYDTGLFPIARVLQPVAAGVPVVCEASVFASRSDWSRSGILFAPYEGLVDACRALLRSPAEQQRRAAQAQRFAQGIDFAGAFEQVLHALAGRLARPVPRVSPLPAPLPVSPPQPIAPPRTMEAPQPIAPPRPATTAAGDSAGAERTLSNEEIEAILAREAEGLPPEAHLQAPPLKLAERHPGQGRYGVWIVALLVIFSLYTIWQSMPR